MHIEPQQCSVPGCYGKPIFAGLCNTHCTRGAMPSQASPVNEDLIEQARRIIREKADQMPGIGNGHVGIGPGGHIKGFGPGVKPENIQENDIVKIDLNPGRRNSDARMSDKYPKYYKPVPDGVKDIDIYMLCKMFRVDDPSGALHHAIKKILLPGTRTGGKSRYDDIKEARDTLTRWLEIYK
jgi:hypothetical protein